MGIAIGDYNNDRNLDYYQTDIGHGTLTTGNGTGSLGPADSIKLVNPADPNDSQAGWGTAFVDADNDGFVDLVRANFGVNGVGPGGHNDFFLNNGNSTFTEMAANVGLTGANGLGSGLAVADFNNDGRMDVISGGGQGVNLYQNNSTPGSWITFNLVGNKPNHRGIGAKVYVNSTLGSDVRLQMREIHAGSSLGSTNDHRAHFGLGDHDTISLAQVVWSSGCTQVVAVQSFNQIINVEEWQCGLPDGVAGSVNIDSGSVLEGVTVTASDYWSGEVQATDISDVDGHYSLPVDVCICGMTASKVGWSISWDNIGPGGQNWAWINSNLVLGDFTATRTSGTLSGQAIGADGNPMPGVSVTASNQNGSNVVTVSTDVNGRYVMAVPDDVYWVQGDAAPGCSSFWPEGGSFFASLVTVNLDDKEKNVVCQP